MRPHPGTLIDGGVIQDSDLDILQRFARERALTSGGAGVADSAVADSIVAAHNPHSPALEPLRALRSQLMLGWLNNAARGALAITSPEPAEGRSWLAANLAVLFAQAGQRTLLIDADLRRPCQHRLFNLDNSLGLSAVLTGRANARDVVHRIHPSLELLVLPAGAAAPNPQELLVRTIFEQMLDRFVQLFDVVLLDTPAATRSADFQIIAARAGTAVLVSRRNHTRISGLASTMRCLTDTGVRVLGSVANNF
jgi:protein-tyrosine kinase